MTTMTRYSLPLLLASAALVAGCTTKAKTTSGGGGSGSGAGQSSSTGPDPHYACVESSFMANGPLQGPGYDPTKGGFTGTPQSSYVVSSTQLYTNPSQDMPFEKAFAPVIASLGSSPDGLVAYSLGQDMNCQVWRTMAVWESQDKMMAWVGSDPHATAASKAKDVSVSAKITFWSATPDDVKALTWDVARSHLDQSMPLY